MRPIGTRKARLEHVSRRICWSKGCISHDPSLILLKSHSRPIKRILYDLQTAMLVLLLQPLSHLIHLRLTIQSHTTFHQVNLVIQLSMLDRRISRRGGTEQGCERYATSARAWTYTTEVTNTFEVREVNGRSPNKDVRSYQSYSRNSTRDTIKRFESI